MCGFFLKKTFFPKVCFRLIQIKNASLRFIFSAMKQILLLALLFISFFSYGQKRETYPPIPFDSTLYKSKLQFLKQPANGNSKKNIILIVADDMGKYDLSIYGNPFISTPNIDQLAKDGILFNTGYSTAPVCSPSRAGFLTGRYQQRFGYHIQPHQRYANSKFQLWAFQHLINTSYLKPENYAAYPSKTERLKQGLPHSEITLSELLHHNGYRTAWIGKWNLGYSEDMSAQNYGFDYCYGFNEAYSLYANPHDKNIVNARIHEFTDRIIWKGGRKGACAIYENGVKINEKEYLTYAIFRRAKAFISQQSNQPFFVYLPVNAPHTPYQAPKDIYNQLSNIQDHNKRVYYSIIKALDNSIGDLITYLKQIGQYDNTLIVFTSDNGAELYSQVLDNKPLNGGKFTLFEGGINIPLIISCPSLIKTPQKVDEMVSLLDLFPTIAEVTNTTLPTDRTYDGYSLTPYFSPQTKNFPKHEYLFWYMSYNSAIRNQHLKVIQDTLNNKLDIFDFSKNRYELIDISPSKESYELLQKLKEFRAKMPRMYWPRVMNYEVKINGKIYRWGV